MGGCRDRESSLLTNGSQPPKNPDAKASLRQVAGSQQQPQEFLPLAAKRDHAVAGVLDVAEQDRRAMAGRGQLQG